MNSKRILLFADSKWRDAPACALLKKTLERRLDVAVLVCSFHLWEQAISLYNPHLVIINHIQGKRNKRIANHVKRHGGMVAVLFNEGILEFAGKRAIFEAQVENADVDLFLCWNEQVAALLDDRAVVVGSPRFDFYPPKDPRELACEKLGFDPLDPVVIFGDSWPSAKFKYSHRKFHEQNWSDLGNTVKGPWENAAEFAQAQYDLQEQFKLMVLNARSIFPNIQMAVKTHPMSDYFRWADWGRRYAVKIIHGAYIFDVLNAADAYVTKAGSITVAESWLCGKPVVKLLTDYDDGSSGEQILCDELISSFGDAPNWIEEALIWDFRDEDYSDYLHKWGLVPTDAARKIVDTTKHLLDRASPPEPNLPALFGAVRQHDVHYAVNRLDGFGNYDKAITQMDMDEWRKRLT